MSTLNYKKWDHIEVSDDEDDVHPNIDTPSLFRWRHQARVERMAEHSTTKTQVIQSLTDLTQRLSTAQQELASCTGDSAKQTELKEKVEKYEKELEIIRRKDKELQDKERLMPQNVDTLCKEGKVNKSMINKITPSSIERPEEKVWENYQDFTAKNKDDIKKFAMFSKPTDAENFMLEHKYLVCDETANYLVMECLDLEIEGKHDLMLHVAYNAVCVNFMLQLARTMKIDPRATIKPFYAKLREGEVEYMKGFREELKAFQDRITVRGAEKRKALIAEVEEEERQARLGPGGLDPQEVFESLPKPFQECFEKRDIGALQELIKTTPLEEAKDIMKRCVDSGLWCPSGEDGDEDEGEEGAKNGEEVGASVEEVEETADTAETKTE